MRGIAIVPVVLCTVALILSFLCLFAGSKRNFMEDYAVVTLNTSRIGEQLAGDVLHDIESIIPLRPRGILSSVEAHITSAATAAASLASGATKAAKSTEASTTKTDSPNLASIAESKLTQEASGLKSKATSLASAAESKASSLGHHLGEDLGDELQDIAKKLGLHDFYSAHILDFCEGYYIPGPVPNATVKQGSIHKNVTSCSNKTALYHFDPKKTLAEEIKEKTNGKIDLTELHWPKDIDRGLDALKIAQKAVFVFYCLAIGLIFLSLVAAVVGVVNEGRLSCLINFGIDGMALLCICVASIIVTIIAVKASHLINHYGKDIGVSASRGNRFLALTWSATGLMFVSFCVWVFDFIVACRRVRRERSRKYG